MWNFKFEWNRDIEIICIYIFFVSSPRTLIFSISYILILLLKSIEIFSLHLFKKNQINMKIFRWNFM